MRCELPAGYSHRPGDPQGIERATIITISIKHLHPQTIADLVDLGGDIPSGPAIALRGEGFIVNSDYGSPSVLNGEFLSGAYGSFAENYPDLTLIRALARGLKAEWINIDRDGPEHGDILPTYDEGICVPTADRWRDVLSYTGQASKGHQMVIASREVLECIEAGQTPAPPSPAIESVPEP